MPAEKPKSEFSRREFLKLGGSALVFLSELGLPKEVFAQLEKILAGL